MQVVYLKCLVTQAFLEYSPIKVGSLAIREFFFFFENIFHEWYKSIMIVISALSSQFSLLCEDLIGKNTLFCPSIMGVIFNLTKLYSV